MDVESGELCEEQGGGKTESPDAQGRVGTERKTRNECDFGHFLVSLDM